MISLDVARARTLPSEHVRVGDALQLHVHVLAGLRADHLLVVDGDADDLRVATVGHQQHVVAEDLRVTPRRRPHQPTRLHLAGDHAAAVVVLVQHRQTQRAVGVAAHDLDRVQDLEE